MNKAKLAIAFTAASIISTMLITTGTIFFYQGRGFVFGADSWTSQAWAYARAETYLYGILVNFALVGIPVAVCTFFLALRLCAASERWRVVASTLPSIVTLFPAWWSAAWNGPNFFALIVGALSAAIGAGIFLLAAFLAGYTRERKGVGEWSLSLNE
ncbi:hypothetical protein CH252_20790 [Rhodococcus sp. 06-1477-1B]|nr:hypothetical protein CH252_20790 [Rhodococcus sp. 06-1477-1B]